MRRRSSAANADNINKARQNPDLESEETLLYAEKKKPSKSKIEITKVQRQVAPPVQPESTPIPTSLGQSDSEVAIDLKQTKKSTTQSKNRKKIESIERIKNRKNLVTDESDQEHSADKENPNAHKAVKSRKRDKITDESDQEQSAKGLKSRDHNRRRHEFKVPAVPPLIFNADKDSAAASTCTNKPSAMSMQTQTTTRIKKSESFNTSTIVQCNTSTIVQEKQQLTSATSRDG